MKKRVVRVGGSAVVVLALQVASARSGVTASADSRAVLSVDRVGQGARASAINPPSGFMPNPQALSPSQVTFPATRLSAVNLSAHNPPVGRPARR